MKIVPLKDEFIEDAAALVSRRYKLLREQQPLLPAQYQEAGNILPLLQRIMSAGGPGVAAIQEGQLAGFFIGWLMPNFRGKRSVYSPDWANAARSENCGFIYEEMYRELAANWVAEKYIAHYISIFANDLEAIRACHWLGFGMFGVDAIRGLEPVKSINNQIEIRHASTANLEQVMKLYEGMAQYAKGSPYFFIGETYGKEYFETWLNDPDRVIWLAYVNEDPVAFIGTGPANHDVSTIIIDEKTTSIYGAFTQETMRGKGIAAALLAHAIESARGTGYERCAVDFESMNLLAVRFWLRHDFKPVSLSLLRYIDERVV